MNTKQEIRKAIEDTQNIKVDKLPSCLLILSFLCILGPAITASTLIKENSFAFEAFMFTGLALFVVLVFISVYLIQKKQNKYLKKCCKCEKNLQVIDLKIIHTTNKCPYCAEIIIKDYI
jgi:hypothetical protein